MGRVKREGINFSKEPIPNTGTVFCISECVQLPKGLVAVVVQSLSGKGRIVEPFIEGHVLILIKVKRYLLT